MPIVHNSYKYKKRHSWSPITYILDIADYKIGWIFRLPFVKIIKVKTSKIMETPKYATIIEIFNNTNVTK